MLGWALDEHFWMVVFLIRQFFFLALLRINPFIHLLPLAVLWFASGCWDIEPCHGFDILQEYKKFLKLFTSLWILSKDEPLWISNVLPLLYCAMDGLSLDTSQSKISDYSGSICLQCCNDSLGIKVSGRVRDVHELCYGLWYCFKELVSIFLCPDMPDLLLFGHSIERITNWRRVHSALINLQKIDYPPHHKGFLLPDWLTCVGIPGTQISN